MMNVTQQTEKTINKMVKNDMRYASELLYLLNELKGRISWYGGTIKEIEKAGYHVDNTTQINIYVSNLLRGMGILFEKYITVVDLYDLHHATIKDFNGLVKICYSENMKRGVA